MSYSISCKEALELCMLYGYVTQFTIFKRNAFMRRNNLSSLFGSHSENSKAHFALVISHRAVGNKLMFIYHVLKSLTSRPQLVKTGEK